MEHYDFMQTLNEMASNSWGKKFPDQQSAERAMLEDPQKMTAIAVLNLLAGFNKFIDAMYFRNRTFRNEKPKKYSTCVPRPDSKVGDILWSGCLENGFCRSVIAAKDSEDIPLTVPCDDAEYAHQIEYAGSDEYPSLKEAVIAAAEHDISWHRPRAEYAIKVLEAARSGASLDEFIPGHDYDAQGEATE